VNHGIDIFQSRDISPFLVFLNHFFFALVGEDNTHTHTHKKRNLKKKESEIGIVGQNAMIRYENEFIDVGQT